MTRIYCNIRINLAIDNSMEDGIGERTNLTTPGYHNRFKIQCVYSPQLPSTSYHHPSLSFQRPTMYPRNQRLPQRPAVLRSDASTFYPRQRTQNNKTVFQPHQT
ncbi:hypothetical protein TNCV_1241311 [Trichonephila clavipes]|uniref:Uncharacterized protein n=1 Tax=Trichonephila clavipes TaxID=2585209 RepID=A0A8X6WFX9_TRICX|nr:hypothetical protein TNCV_1241311 [Trichonephila clavipes]